MLSGRGLLYRLDFSSGKSYIGVTCGPLATRVRDHRTRAARGSRAAVHAAWRRHGEPRAVSLAVVPESDLMATEQRAIAVFGTLAPGGYNMTPGGEVSPMKIPEIAARVTAKMRGRVLSTAHRAKIAATLAQRPNPSTRPEVARKIAAALRGVKHSPERVANMRRALTGRTLSDQARAAIAAGHRGIPMPLAVRSKISATRRATARKYAYEGRELSLYDWAERLGLRPQTLQGRLARGWSIEEAFSTC